MFFSVFLAFTLAITCYAGSVKLTDDIHLDWAFVSTEKIQFTYTVNNSLKEDFEWVGFGLQKPGASGMSNADIVSIVFWDKGIDSWAKGVGRPDPDESLGGSNNVENFTTTNTPNAMVFIWERALVTKDKWDHDIAMHQEFQVMYAWGNVDDKGELLQHSYYNRGKKIVRLGDGSTTSFLSFLDS